MGEVLQARNTKLNRDVALKVPPEAFTVDPDCLERAVAFKLPEQVASDPDLQYRFERERRSSPA